MRGGAPPHKNNLIGTAACGWTQIGPFKMDTKAFSFSLLLANLLETLVSSLDCAVEHPQPYTIWRGSTHASKVSDQRNKCFSLLIARSLVRSETSASSVIAPGSGPRLYYQADHLKNSKTSSNFSLKNCNI